MKNIPLFIFFQVCSYTIYSQSNLKEQPEGGGEYPIERNDVNKPCISAEGYKMIEKRITENQELLKNVNVNAKETKTTTILFSWPLKAANGLNDCSYYFIANYVDEDTTSPGIKDYNCGTVTYDGHRGNDICIWPFAFYKMDNNLVEVVAAAPGTIIDKSDGNFDKNCAFNSLTANYIIIQHADGSRALYWHMKKNTVTAKTIGQTVSTGEFLGYVGSSGSSTAPHLHFEVWSTAAYSSLVESFSGTCNVFNSSSWWQVQKPYTEPAVIKASIDSAVPIMPACPATETPNEDSCYHAGVTAIFAIFLRNETPGKTANLRIVNPNNTTFNSWTHSSTNSYLASWWYWTQVLPATAGTYTFETVYNGDTCTKKFTINCSQASSVRSDNVSQLNIFPNPANNTINISSENIDKGTYKFTLRNVMGQIVLTNNAIVQNNSIEKSFSIAELANGLYFLIIETGDQRIVKKIIKQDQ